MALVSQNIFSRIYDIGCGAGTHAYGLAETEHETQFEDVAAPLPIGPTMRIRSCWFRHNRL